MKVSKRISNEFEPEVKSEGKDYYRYGHIELVRLRDDHVQAEAYGSELYSVEVMNPVENIIKVSCSCPRAKSGKLCKHVWASILKAESQGWVPNATATTQPIEVQMFHQDNDEYDELDNDDYYYGTKELNAHLKKLKGWQKTFEEVKTAMTTEKPRVDDKEKLLYYLVSAEPEDDGIMVDILLSEMKGNGEWGKAKKRRIENDIIPNLIDIADQEIIASLFGTRKTNEIRYSYFDYKNQGTSRFILQPELQVKLIKAICQTGRAKVMEPGFSGEAELLTWDESAKWEFQLRIEKADKSYEVSGVFVKDNEILEIEEPQLLVESGLLIFDGQASVLDDFGAYAWIEQLRSQLVLKVPQEDSMLLLDAIYKMPKKPPMTLPDELQVEAIHLKPKKELYLRFDKNDDRSYAMLLGELKFRYGEVLIDAFSSLDPVIDAQQAKLIYRDRSIESEANEEMMNSGFRVMPHYNLGQKDSGRWSIPMSRLSSVVNDLIEKGWRVEADGKRYRKAGSLDMSVRSGIDWFELHGKAAYGSQQVSLPQLLKAIQKGDGWVELGDGSVGLLPEEWLKQYASLADLGEIKEDHLQFKQSQAMLLDALIASKPGIDVDKAYIKMRDSLLEYAELKPKDPPKSFEGTLRHYQTEGLAWFYFLQSVGVGGCLADDMGLGKTVQVLALLEGRRTRKVDQSERKPSLIVVPRSLVFNWQAEVEKFTPDLTSLIYTGPNRHSLRKRFAKHDIIITTYGTLRRDVVELGDIEFDYVILDEAQAIKNAGSQASKSVRVLNADNRLALSGTPIENHMGELWSLFEFLNPGMFGKLKAFDAASEGESRELLKRVLKPFILRRTKSEVAKDLPKKIEQTIYCEMDEKQQAMYNELKEYYQKSLAQKIQDSGLGKSKIQVLEALLRLRQAACHPALVDENYGEASSAKLDLLWDHIHDVMEEGHKVLVFSQFTSFLSILRKRLDKEELPYLYLDGRTKKRQERVDAFQNDDQYKLFLISLKAGGLGLNLTAAEYVFILDPWWNPAVEAQAIDRAYRIGQRNNVFAYRIISRGTVEEKVVALQDNKRELVEGILSEDKSVMKSLSEEDLDYLLS